MREENSGKTEAHFGSGQSGAEKVVRLGAAAAGELLTLQRAAFAAELQFVYPTYTDPITQDLQQMREEFTERDARAVGLREAGRLVGAVRFRPLDLDAVFLYRLSVAPDKAGEGIGGRVMRAALDAIREEFPWATRVEMGADGKLDWLIAWYERLGFRVVQRGTESSPDEWKLALKIGAED